MPYSPTDTIVAVATPPGRGGIGVVRLAGPQAAHVARVLTGRDRDLVPRHATLCAISDPGARVDAPAVVDQVVVTWFAAPHSYTGDDVVEISGHGSPVLQQRIVELALGAGARLAEPGEFTLRAYLNGRLDLVQAEAVADLVNAVTPLQARAAMDQLEGTLTSALGKIDAGLFDLTARLEASLDFPEEGFHFITREEACRDVARLRGELADLVRDGRAGRVVREGRLVVIAGRPNTGKSSLFNALAGTARAIVTDVPGTTRDVLTEVVDVDGIPVTLVDTAGQRESTDQIEVEGVRRARQAQQVAALAIVVFDRSVPLTEEDRRLVTRAVSPALIAVNKCDRPAAWTLDDLDAGATAVETSALRGDGLAALRSAIVVALTGRETLRDVPAISNVRHVQLAAGALEALDRAAAALGRGATEELVLADLTSARARLEEITGHRTPDDVLRHIFETFCVGK